MILISAAPCVVRLCLTRLFLKPACVRERVCIVKQRRVSRHTRSMCRMCLNSHGLSILPYDRHFLHLITDFHQIGMRSNVWLLFLFITVDPDLTCVLLSSDKLGLLIDLVKKLLALDFVLFLLRFLFNFKWVCLTFDLCQLLLLFFKLDFVGLE